jgi:hypothetical protein
MSLVEVLVVLQMSRRRQLFHQFLGWRGKAVLESLHLTKLLPLSSGLHASGRFANCPATIISCAGTLQPALTDLFMTGQAMQGNLTSQTEYQAITSKWAWGGGWRPIQPILSGFLSKLPVLR